MFGIPFLSPKVIAVIVLALVVTAILGYVFHLGGEGPRAEKAQLEADIASAWKIKVANYKRKDAETAALITTLEGKHAENLRLVTAGWAAYHDDELRRERERVARRGSQPARTEAHVCNDPDKDRGLSDAIQNFKLAARRALGLCRSAVTAGREDAGRLLEVAGEQASELVLLKSYVLGVDRINTAPVAQ